MTRTALVVAVLTVVTGTASAVHLAVAPQPFASSSAAVIAIGTVLFTVIAVVGLALVRGRWARWLSAALVSASAGIAALGDVDVWAWVAIVAGLAALGGIAGRWLDGWLRARPSATGPHPKMVAILLGLLALVPAVGVAAPSGLKTAHGLLGAAGVLLAWAYGKAQLWSLWAMRLVLPMLGILAAVVSPIWGAVFLIAVVTPIVGLAWSKEARLAVDPLLDDLPGPRPLRNRTERK